MTERQTPCRIKDRPLRRRAGGRIGALTFAMFAVSALACATATAAALGELDSSFGGGVVELPAGTQLNGAAVQRDGAIVVTGLTGGASAPRLLVARLTSQGNLDSSFSQDGLVTVPLPDGAVGAIGEDVAIQEDGRIVVVGGLRADSGADGMLVARYDADGGPDATFGNSGVATALRGVDRQAEANAVEIRPNGSIVLGGGATPGIGSAVRATIVQLTSNGSRAGDAHLLDIGESSIDGLALQSDGRIAFAGSRKVGQVIVTVIGRANADGTIDSSFRDGGAYARSLARGNAAASAFDDVAVEPGGKLIATGYALDGRVDQAGSFLVTARFDGSGNPDGSFGSDGVRYFAAAQQHPINTQPAPGGASIAISGGHIYTGGSFDNSGSSALLLQAQGLSGDADDAFGGGAGQTVTPVRNYAAPGYGNAVALSPDGIYLVGTSGRTTGDKTTGVIARYGAYPFALQPQAPTTEAPTPTAPTPTPAPAPTAPTPAPAPTAPTPTAPVSGSSVEQAKFPAKIQVLRAGVRNGKLDVLARITARATGRVKVSYVSSGKRTTFTIPISKHRIRFKRKLPMAQRRKSTGIFTLEYEGNDRVRPDEVRLRAANGKARLKRGATRIDSKGRLLVSGTISGRARGVVRVRLGYDTSNDGVEFLPYRAKIRNGAWSLTEKLPAAAAKAGGQLSIQFTGYEPRRMRGEQLAKAVTPA